MITVEYFEIVSGISTRRAFTIYEEPKLLFLTVDGFGENSKTVSVILRKSLEYPLLCNELIRMCMPNQSPFCCYRFEKSEKLNLMTHLNVCFGWNDFLCSSWCESVGLKRTELS